MGAKPDPYWFGGYINDRLLTIEIVSVLREDKGYIFTEYRAENIKGEVIVKNSAERLATIKFISDIKPSVFP